MSKMEETFEIKEIIGYGVKDLKRLVRDMVMVSRAIGIVPRILTSYARKYLTWKGTYAVRLFLGWTGTPEFGGTIYFHVEELSGHVAGLSKEFVDTLRQTAPDIEYILSLEV